MERIGKDHSERREFSHAPQYFMETSLSREQLEAFHGQFGPMDMKKTVFIFPFGRTTEILDEIRPSFVIVYDMSLDVIRSVEVRKKLFLSFTFTANQVNRIILLGLHRTSSLDALFSHPLRNLLQKIPMTLSKCIQLYMAIRWKSIVFLQMFVGNQRLSFDYTNQPTQG
jgi:hypothetical protein